MSFFDSEQKEALMATCSLCCFVHLLISNLMPLMILILMLTNMLEFSLCLKLFVNIFPALSCLLQLLIFKNKKNNQRDMFQIFLPPIDSKYRFLYRPESPKMCGILSSPSTCNFNDISFLNEWCHHQKRYNFNAFSRNPQK